jgi:hypothetical protein
MIKITSPCTECKVSSVADYFNNVGLDLATTLSLVPLFWEFSQNKNVWGHLSHGACHKKKAFLAIKRHDMAKSQQKNESSSCKFKIKFEYRFDPRESIGKKIGRYYLCYTMGCKIHSTLAWLIVRRRSLQLSTVQCNLNSKRLLRNPRSSHASLTCIPHKEGTYGGKYLEDKGQSHNSQGIPQTQM